MFEFESMFENSKVASVVLFCKGKWRPMLVKLFRLCFANYNSNLIFVHGFCLPSTLRLICLHPRERHWINWRNPPSTYIQTHVWRAPPTGRMWTNGSALQHCINMFFDIPTVPLCGESHTISLEIHIYDYEYNGAAWFQNLHFILWGCELPWSPQLFYNWDTQSLLPLPSVSYLQVTFTAPSYCVVLCFPSRALIRKNM